MDWIKEKYWKKSKIVYKKKGNGKDRLDNILIYSLAERLAYRLVRSLDYIQVYNLELDYRQAYITRTDLGLN